jgi:hypothetical protein
MKMVNKQARKKESLWDWPLKTGTTPGKKGPGS